MAQVSAIAPTTNSNSLSLPRPIRRALGRIDRRLRAIAALRGLGTFVLVAAIGAAMGVAVDFAWGLPSTARWGVWLSWVIALSVTLLGVLWRVFVRHSQALELAAVIERGDPALRERLTGVVGLLGANAHGSPALIAALSEDASEHVGAIHLSRAAPAGSAGKRLALAAATAALVVAPALIRDDPCGQLARRFLMPWANLDRVGRFVVEVEPGNTVLAIGDDLAISARIVPRFGSRPPEEAASLEWTDPATGRTRRTAMEANSASNADTGRSFLATLPRLPGSITYRVVSRSGESRRFRAEVIAPPSVAAISARVEPPLYTKMSAILARDATRFEAWEDSRVILTVTPSLPVISAEVTWPGEAHAEWGGGARSIVMGHAALIQATGWVVESSSEAQRTIMTLSDDGKTATATLTASKSGEYTIALKEVHGLKSRPEPSRRVVVRPDAPPVVALKGSEEADQARGDDTLRVAVAARDDVAVAAAELHYTVERASDSEDSEREKGEVKSKLEGLDTATARGEIALGLKSLKVNPGDVVAYRIRVADNRPAPRGPNVVWSASKRLIVSANAQPLWSQQNQADRAALKATIEELRKNAVENRQQTEQLRYAADAVLRGNGEWDRDRKQALGQREAEAGALGEKLEAFARDLEEDPTFRPLARPARQVAKVEAEAARSTLDQARQANDPSQRLADLRQADIRLGAVVSRLDEVQRQFNDIAGRDDDRRHLQDLADKQDQVASHAEDKAGGPQDRALLDQLEAEQNHVKNDLDALLKKSPLLKADVLDAQAKEADALARRARVLANRQRDESRKTAEMAGNLEAFRKLAEEQRAIEDDARRLALDADTPLVENGRGKVNTDSIRQAAEPLERGDIDQSRNQLQNAEGELRRLARDLDDVPGDLKALARRLAARQDQLANETLEALGESRNKPSLPNEDKQALAKRLAPLADRQKAIAGLVSAMLDTKEAKADRQPRFPADVARSAAEASKKAAEADANPANPREIESFVNSARNAMHKLAGSVPDQWQREEPIRRAIAEARQVADHALRDVDQHLRETEHLLEKEPARAAHELANRLNPVADRAREAAKRLDAIDTPQRLTPQRDRAGKRERKLSEAVEALRAEAPRDPKALGFDSARAKVLREALQNAMTENRVALDRLDQKLNGQVPADDLAAELLEDQRQLIKANPDQDKADAAADQQRLITALRTLSAPDAPREQAEAVRLAERALSGKEAERNEAARAIAALGERLAGGESPRADADAKADAPRDPNLNLDPGLAEKARQLAHRERRVREGLQTLLGERVAPQQAVRKETAELGRELADLRDRAREMSPRAAGPAHEAASLLGEQAPRAMQEAANHLAQGNSAPARDTQRRAAELAERGAQNAEDLAAALRADRGIKPESSEAKHQATPNPVAAAREAMAQATRQLGKAREQPGQNPSALDSAKNAMRGAAEKLQVAARNQGQNQPQRAESLAKNPNQPGADSPVRDPEGGRAGTAAPETLRELQEMVRRKTGRKWGELPGHLRTEILQMSQGRYRDDYTRLIQLYFQEIAADAKGKP